MTPIAFFAKVRIMDTTNNADPRTTMTRDQIVKANLGLVHYVANKFRYNGRVEYADLVQAGCMGLLRAIDKFDPTKACFSTYAHMWIRSYVMREIEKAPVMRTTQWQGSIPLATVSTSAAAYHDDDGRDTVGDTLADDSLRPDACELDLERDKILTLLGSLDDCSRMIVIDRMFSDNPLSLDAIGKRFGMGREAVRQRECKLRAILDKRVKRAA